MYNRLLRFPNNRKILSDNQYGLPYSSRKPIVYKPPASI